MRHIITSFSVIACCVVVAVTVPGVDALSRNTVASSLQDGLNENDQAASYRIYDKAWYALEYVPEVSYFIDRIEMIHGVGAGGAWVGTVVIQVRADDNGLPSNSVLTEGSHLLAFTVGFQGADLPPVELTAGAHYWITFAPVDSSQASIGEPDTGDIIPFCYSDNGVTWTKIGPAPRGDVWIARFYGTAISVGVEPTTWRNVKELYRD